MKSLSFWRGCRGGCTSLTSMPLAAHAQTQAATHGGGGQAKDTPAALRAEVTKAHARRMKMDGNLFTGCFISAHTGQKRQLCPHPVQFFSRRIERQCLMTGHPDIYGY